MRRILVDRAREKRVDYGAAGRSNLAEPEDCPLADAIDPTTRKINLAMRMEKKAGRMKDLEAWNFNPAGG
jgi:hypothetical protein